MTDGDCLFCKIVAKDLDSENVHESENVLAFRDINPAAPTHILVIPKKHVRSAAELGADDGPLLGEIFATIARLASDAGSDSYRVVTNVGGDAGQTVHHLHFHLIAGRSMSWPPG
ncbi:MAG: histidine triad family protein [Actinomycetota bacterium]|jgi:histidine triad (HIT) family protein|nr:histidine triad family protein [Actinomycetota bacterium]